MADSLMDALGGQRSYADTGDILAQMLARRPRVPISGAEGPRGEPFYAPETAPEPASALPSWVHDIMPYKPNPRAALEGLLMSSGMTGGPSRAVTGAVGHIGERLAASPATQKLAAALGLGGATVAGMAPTEAGEKAADPRLQKLQELDKEIAANRTKLERQATTNFQSKTARDNAAQPFLDAIKDAGARKAAIENDLDAEEKATANSSFSKAQPVLNTLWPGIQWAGPVAAAMLTRGAGNLAERGLTAPWRASVTAAEKAMSQGNATNLAYEAGKAVEHANLGSSTPIRKAGDFVRETLIPTAAGAGVGMEASMFPYQYDRRNAPEGSRERDAAEKALGEDFWSTAMKGLGPGVLGGFTGAHLPNIGPGYRPVAETNNLKNFLEGGVVSTSPSASVGPGGPAPASSLVRALGDDPSATAAPAQRQLPAPAAAANPDDLVRALLSPAANRNAPATPLRVKDSRGRINHHNPDTGRFTKTPDAD